MRLGISISAALLLGGWLALAGPGVLAEGEPEAPAAEPKPVLRMVRTKRILTTLEASYEKERAAETPDTALLDSLERAMQDAKALLLPIQPEELTETEREDLKEALGASGGKDDGAEEPAEDDNPLNGWQQRALERAFEGAELSEEEEAAAAPIISEWFTQNWQARADRDSKAQSDLKRERDDQLKKLLGRKKSRKLINNINGAMGRGR